MPLSNTAVTAFQTASGTLPDTLSIAIRTILIVLIFIWGAWCIYGEVQHMKHHDVDTEKVLFNVFRISFLIVLAMCLVFI